MLVVGSRLGHGDWMMIMMMMMMPMGRKEGSETCIEAPQKTVKV
jgi:hypothetical protein